jgi:hypothetical protein
MVLDQGITVRYTHHVTWETNNVRGGQFIKENTSSRR